MTELETRLMDALSALSAQWEADQDQQAGEQGMLSARLDDLAQQVSDSAGSTSSKPPPCRRSYSISKRRSGS